MAHRLPSASIVIEYAEPKRNSNSNTEVKHENMCKGNSGLPPTQSHMDADEWYFICKDQSPKITLIQCDVVGGLDLNVENVVSWLMTLNDADKADGLYIRGDFVTKFLKHLFTTSAGGNCASTRLLSCVQVTSHIYMLTWQAH